MKKNVCLFAICLFLALPAMLPAQTAERMEQLLQTKAVRYDQAARFVLEAAELIGPLNGSGLAGQAHAFSYVMEQKWLPASATADGEAQLKELSLLIMQSFGIKGGLFYTLFKNPHYAYRELVYRDIIQDNAYPGMTVSGEALLFMINRVFSLYEDNPWDRQYSEEEILLHEISAQLERLAVKDTSVMITGEGVTISLSNIQFVPNSAELTEEGKREFADIARILQTVSPRNILVTGHTAMAGTEEDRLNTSRARAQSVKDFIVSLGIRSAGEITVEGRGAEKPIADNNSPEGMTLNRRVEITILRQQ